jgi:hypothetical protein
MHVASIVRCCIIVSREEVEVQLMAKRCRHRRPELGDFLKGAITTCGSILIGIIIDFIVHSSGLRLLLQSGLCKCCQNDESRNSLAGRGPKKLGTHAAAA